MNVYDLFIAEVEAMTIQADDSAVKVVGELTRAVKRAQNAWDAMSGCGHTGHMLIEGVRYGDLLDGSGMEPCPEADRERGQGR